MMTNQFTTMILPENSNAHYLTNLLTLEITLILEEDFNQE